MNIYHEKHIEIKAPPAAVFRYIETIPQKFPTSRMFDAAPVMFVRIALVDGISSAAAFVMNREYRDRVRKGTCEPLHVGSTMGPFTLADVIPPEKYFFTINSKFARGETGYRLAPSHVGTTLYFEYLAENPSALERVWWFWVRPAHHLLAGVVLRNIRRGAEQSFAGVRP